MCILTADTLHVQQKLTEHCKAIIPQLKNNLKYILQMSTVANGMNVPDSLVASK